MGYILNFFYFILKALFLFFGIGLLVGLILGMLAVREWWMSEKQIDAMEQQYKIDTSGKSNTWEYGTPKQHSSKKQRKSN